MTFEEYSREAIKTASCNRDVIISRLFQEKPDNLSLLHAALGMCSEAGEVYEWMSTPKTPSVLQNAELIAELGDCLWYFNLAVHSFHIDFHSMCAVSALAADDFYNVESFYDNVGLGAELMATGAGKVSDLTKASIFYGRFVDLASLAGGLSNYLSGIILCCRALKVTLEEVMEKNIAKLRARYGDIFSEEKANKRDIQKECKAYSNG